MRERGPLELVHLWFVRGTLIGAQPRALGDYVGWVSYSLGTLKANGSKTVKFVYRQF